jgi:hypothetical protein
MKLIFYLVVGLQVVASMLLAASAVSARTWNVRVDGTGDAPTVQAGIDSAAAGDTVLVFPGTYNEAIDFLGKAIVVKSASGPEATILDGTGMGDCVVTFRSGEGQGSVLEELRITGGICGVAIINAQPAILDNVITGNAGNINGGGVICGADTFFPWYPLIKGNTITHNLATNLGGGVATEAWMVPDILDNYIADNEARDGDGGGIYYRSFDNGAVIRGNTIINNRAGDHGGGIYAALIGSPPPALELEISWNLIANNAAAGSDITGESGGGITLIETDAWAHHNTIVANEGGSTATTLGGGIAIERIGSPLIETNIIALTTQGGGVFCLQGATPILRNNLAWQNVPADGVGSCPDWWQSNGNIVADPYFCNAALGDYTLAADSPAITHPAGPLGAFPAPGCGPVPVIPTTWGRIKSMYQ